MIRGTAVGDNAESADFLQRAAHGTLVHWIGLTPQAGTHLKSMRCRGLLIRAVRSLPICSNVWVPSRRHRLHRLPNPWRLGAHSGGLCRAVGGHVGGLASARQKVDTHRCAGAECGGAGLLERTVFVAFAAAWLDCQRTRPTGYLPMVCVLGVALIMPFFGRHRHYCTWVCPYGSLQELAGRLPLPKIPCSPRVFRIMSRVRMGVLSLLLLLLWTGVGGFLLNYERSPSLLTKVCLRWSWCWARCLWWPVALCRTFGARHAARWVPCSI